MTRCFLARRKRRTHAHTTHTHTHTRTHTHIHFTPQADNQVVRLIWDSVAQAPVVAEDVEEPKRQGYCLHLPCPVVLLPKDTRVGGMQQQHSHKYAQQQQQQQQQGQHDEEQQQQQAAAWVEVKIAAVVRTPLSPAFPVGLNGVAALPRVTGWQPSDVSSAIAARDEAGGERFSGRSEASSSGGGGTGVASHLLPSPDLTVSLGLTVTPDLTVSPGSTVSPDLTVTPDLTVSPEVQLVACLSFSSADASAGGESRYAAFCPVRVAPKFQESLGHCWLEVEGGLQAAVQVGRATCEGLLCMCVGGRSPLLSVLCR